MKYLLELRTNIFFDINPDMEISPNIELILIHTDGKKYYENDNIIISETKIAETRINFSTAAFGKFINELQNIQKNLDKLCKLSKSINESLETEK